MTPANAKAQATIPFPKLPVELRTVIYLEAILPEDLTSQSQPLNLGAADARRGGDPLYLQWLEQLCRVNEATRIDVSSVLLQKAKLCLLYPKEAKRFTLFLESFPQADSQGFAAARNLDFQLFGRHRPSAGIANTYIELMSRCTELRQVQLKFEAEHMITGSCKWIENLKWPPTTLWAFDQTRIRQLEDVIAIYRLADLLELKKLHRLTIEAWPRIRMSDRHTTEDILVDCTPLMVSLAQWLREGFAAKGREVTVSYKEASSPGLRWSRRIQGV
ncbi:hypothetical protein G6011_02599 [Alternaria panax]|uniref:Uncharacterized protein n=1 Tax=Alternaria panax TaxID=48097 RepID=A0AAD4I521_9PLEO|nr:hypothetical protein G6011_02599 [Alternaria panax]